MLGKLEMITDLRSIWKHEALDFTNWLAEDVNLQLLGEAIGIDVSLIETEASVGGFSVDILAKEENSDRKIIIENQLEKSDHDHLGKILTYASGYDAEIIIWVLKDIRDEHLQAVTWLNENTNDKINFFVVKIELWKIEESPIAVRFNVVARPNDWTKAIRQSVDASISETKLQQLEYWTQFKDYAIGKGTSLTIRKPQPQHWIDWSFGVIGSRIGYTVNSQQTKITVEIYMDDNMDLYYQYEKNKDLIEKSIGEKLEWMDLPDKKASRIRLSYDADFRNVEDWTRQFEWMMSKGEKFVKVFRVYAVE